MESRSITPPGGEAAALPFGRTRGFKPRVRYNLIISNIKTQTETPSKSGKSRQNGLTPIPYIDISRSRKSAIQELILSLYTPALLIELEWLSPST